MKKKINAASFEQTFDRGGSVRKYLKTSRPRRLNTAVRRVNVDFPTWVIEGLDEQAEKLGVTRQSLVKIWIAKRLEEERAK